MGMQNFIKIYQKVQGIEPVSLFFRIEPRQNLDLSQISFDNLIGYILTISMCMQNFITIFFTVPEIGPFWRFQNLELGKASTDKKCHFAISWARSCQCQSLRKRSSKYSTQGHFHFFRIWHSAKPRPMINIILQFLGLHLFNIKLSAKFYQNIPNDLIVNFHFFRIWISDKPRPIPNVIWQSHGLHLVNIPMCMQNFITRFHSVQEIGPFSLFQNLELGKSRPMKNDISQSLGLDLDNINVYAEVYQYIPLSSRDKAIFTFSKFGAR